jgi:hypothetical protein
MAHPFEKMFDKALKSSTDFDNEVLTKAEELREKGYPGREIATVLLKLSKSLIDPKEAEIVAEAYEEFSEYLED